MAQTSSEDPIVRNVLACSILSAKVKELVHGHRIVRSNDFMWQSMPETMEERPPTIEVQYNFNFSHPQPPHHLDHWWKVKIKVDYKDANPDLWYHYSKSFHAFIMSPKLPNKVMVILCRRLTVDESELDGFTYGASGKISQPDFFDYQLTLDPSVRMNLILVAQFGDFSRYSKKSKLSKDLAKLFESEEDADVSFLVGSEKIKAHKTILKARSDYFKSMFNSGMREAQTDEIRLNDISPDSFRKIIKFIYADDVPSNIEDGLLELLAHADMYGLQDMKNICMQVLVLSIPDILQDIIDILLVAHMLKCEFLIKMATHIILVHKDELKGTENWSKLLKQPEIVDSLLQSSDIFSTSICHLTDEHFASMLSH